jgi:hypothetical protein
MNENLRVVLNMLKMVMYIAIVGLIFVIGIVFKSYHSY